MKSFRFCGKHKPPLTDYDGWGGLHWVGWVAKTKFHFWQKRTVPFKQSAGVPAVPGFGKVLFSKISSGHG